MMCAQASKQWRRTDGPDGWHGNEIEHLPLPCSRPKNITSKLEEGPAWPHHFPHLTGNHSYKPKKTGLSAFDFKPASIEKLLYDRSQRLSIVCALRTPSHQGQKQLLRLIYCSLRTGLCPCCQLEDLHHPKCHH